MTTHDPDDHPTERLPTRVLGRARTPCLTLMNGRVPGLLYRLAVGAHVLGRSLDADITIDEISVSRHHARIEVRDDFSATVEDVGSTNGTCVNGERVERAELQPGDKLTLGTMLVVRFDLLDELDMRLQDELLASSMIDALTGCQNRSFFEAELPREVAYARRARSDLSVALIDVDVFKGINDRFGHQVGDLVLGLVGRALQEGVRTYDTVSRWGGDEFAVVLRGARLADARAVIERVAAGLAELEWTEAEDPPAITLSVGIANVLTEQLDDADRLLRVADARLYEAKRAGRNRIVTTGDFDFSPDLGKSTLDLAPTRGLREEVARRRSANTVRFSEPARRPGRGRQPEGET